MHNSHGGHMKIHQEELKTFLQSVFNSIRVARKEDFDVGAEIIVLSGEIKFLDQPALGLSFSVHVVQVVAPGLVETDAGFEVSLTEPYRAGTRQVCFEDEVESNMGSGLITNIFYVINEADE